MGERIEDKAQGRGKGGGIVGQGARWIFFFFLFSLCVQQGERERCESALGLCGACGVGANSEGELFWRQRTIKIG